MASLSLALLLCIKALYVAVTSLSLVSGLKSYDIRENPQLPYKHTLVFGLSHHGFAQKWSLPLPSFQIGHQAL